MSVAAQCLVEPIYAPIVAASVYASPKNANTIIDKFTAVNVTAGAITLTCWLVPQGESTDNENMLFEAQSIPANSSMDFSIMQNQILNGSDAIWVQASGASSINVRASGRQVT